MELTRFRGQAKINQKGVHDARNPHLIQKSSAEE